MYDKIQSTVAMSSNSIYSSQWLQPLATEKEQSQHHDRRKDQRVKSLWWLIIYLNLVKLAQDVCMVLYLNLRTARSFDVRNVTSHFASRKMEIAFMNTISNTNVPQILISFWKDFRFHYNFIVASLIFRMMWSRKILFCILYIPI